MAYVKILSKFYRIGKDHIAMAVFLLQQEKPPTLAMKQYSQPPVTAKLWNGAIVGSIIFSNGWYLSCWSHAVHDGEDEQSTVSVCVWERWRGFVAGIILVFLQQGGIRLWVGFVQQRFHVWIMVQFLEQRWMQPLKRFSWLKIVGGMSLFVSVSLIITSFLWWDCACLSFEDWQSQFLLSVHYIHSCCVVLHR
jgi:hypothetical protein